MDTELSSKGRSRIGFVVTLQELFDQSFVAPIAGAVISIRYLRKLNILKTILKLILQLEKLKRMNPIILRSRKDLRVLLRPSKM